MKFCHVTFLVKSLNESIRFYQDVIGLSLRRQFSAGDGIDIAFLGNGETEVELICNQAVKEIAAMHSITLGFEVESIPKTIDFLRRKDIEHGEVVQLGTMARCLYILDPNGVRIQLIEYN